MAAAAAAAAAACAGGAGERRGPREQPERPALAARFVYENNNTSSPKVYVLQPWIADLLVNYEQLDANENLLAGQVLRVLNDSTAPGQPGGLQDAVLQVSDGSCYIRVVITSEALHTEENHMQLRLSSLICRIIVLQKYTVCFREEARLEDCEFYLTVQRFIVLPMERQRLESSDGNQEPAVQQKIKELWLRSLTLKNAPSSEPSVSQLIDAIGQNQLEVLKENAEECLDLGIPKDTPGTVKDEVPITHWEAERKMEQHEEIFTVAANILVISPEEEVGPCHTSKADTCEATPGKSSNEKTVLGYPSLISQASSAESTALSDSSEESLDNPWNRLPPISLTLSSSNAEKTFQHDLSEKNQQDVAADSNTPDLLEPCNQDSPEDVPQGEPVQTSSPSLLCSYRDTSAMETGATPSRPAAEAASNVSSPAQDLQIVRSSQDTLPSLSPAFPILPSSHLQSQPKKMPHWEQADSSGTAFPPETLQHGAPCARTQGGDMAGAKRKLLVDNNETLPSLSEQQHPQGVSRGRRKGAGRRLEFASTQGAKKSRKEETGLQHGKELSEEEEEQAPPASGLSSQSEQRRDLQPYVKEGPVQYKYKAPSPELCEQIRSVRISKAMLKWACWILTDGEVDS